MRSVTLWLAIAPFVLSSEIFGQPPGEDPGDFIKQGQALTRQGKYDDALALYRNALQLTPDSYAANSAAGVALDLKGDYAEARRYFAKGIQSASGPDKIRALRDMAVSYGFQGACKDAEKYSRQAYDLQVAAKDYYGAGEAADELGRLCLDSGDFDTAGKWYQAGYETGLREPDLNPNRRNLWEFRWQHAQARIAARRGNQAAARKHMEAARAVLAKGDNPQQQQFLPYLEGYVAFYGGDYKSALRHFQDSNQNDPFIAAMMAQTFEKLGEKDMAMDFYRRVMGFSAHNPTTAYARPLAKKKLGQ